MNIGIYNLSKNEENRILEIFQEFQQSFPNCELINRKDLLGIGEQGKHLMCYFLYLNHTLLIKFKNKDEKLNIFDNSIYENINTTIGLFKRNQFLLKESSNQSSSYISKNNGNKTLHTQRNQRLFARRDGETQLYFQYHTRGVPPVWFSAD